MKVYMIIQDNLENTEIKRKKNPIVLFPNVTTVNKLFAFFLEFFAQCKFCSSLVAVIWYVQFYVLSHEYHIIHGIIEPL